MTSLASAVLLGSVIIAPLSLPGQQLIIATTDHLAFGTISSGDTRQVGYGDPGAARWEVGGSLLSVASSVNFVLPATLSRVGGGASMPISFCSTCAHLWSRTCLVVLGIKVCTGEHQTTFNPSTGYDQLLGLLRESMVIRLGGTIAAAPNQMGGSYSGTVVIQFSGLGL